MFYREESLKDIQTLFTLEQLHDISQALDLYAEICERMGLPNKFTDIQRLGWRFYDLWEATEREGGKALLLEPKICE